MSNSTCKTVGGTNNLGKIYRCGEVKYASTVFYRPDIRWYCEKHDSKKYLDESYMNAAKYPCCNMNVYDDINHVCEECLVKQSTKDFSNILKSIII